MSSNLDRYKKDLEALIQRGNDLQLAIEYEQRPKEVTEAVNKAYGAKAKDFLAKLPRFSSAYQAWYSEAQELIKQLLPDRLEDFTRHYQKPKGRKDISYESYRIEDYLQGLKVTRGYDKEKVVGPDAAIPHFAQQLAMLEAVKGRFESSLFEMRQLLQADLFDSELDAARELLRNKYARAAGALAGVVVERHLGEVCAAHRIVIKKKSPGISDFNEALKTAGVIEVPQWRHIQLLADIRNLCDHSKTKEPTADQVADLIDGAVKVSKTVF